MTKETLLRWLLRIGGAITIMAFPALLLPGDWMVVIHRQLGLGELPRAPIVDYLARSISALYGFHGVLLLLISSNLRRYRAIVLYVGLMNVVFGAMLLAVDFHAGMPWFWTASEGPLLAAFGLVILYLARSTLYGE